MGVPGPRAPHGQGSMCIAAPLIPATRVLVAMQSMARSPLRHCPLHALRICFGGVAGLARRAGT
eukprot:9921378-Alexandrium_andersonii.AAC.1